MYSIAKNKTKIDTDSGSPNSKWILSSAIIILTFLGIYLRIANLNVPARFGDEGCYTDYSKYLAQNGMKQIKTIVLQYNSDSRMWIWPTPIRIGYLYPVSLVMKITKQFSIETVALISCALSILSLGLVVLIGLRFFNAWITAFTLLLFSVSPMDLALARRAWQDEMVGFFAAILIWLSSEISSDCRKKIWYILFFIVGGYSLLIKESSIVAYSLCSVWIAYALYCEKKSVKGPIVFVIIASAVVFISVAVLSWVSGGFANVISVIRNSASSFKSNEYVLKMQSGPWHYYLKSFFAATPLSTILACIGIAYVFLSRNVSKSMKSKKSLVFQGIAGFIVAFIFVATIPKHLKNVRFISAVYIPFYFMAATALWSIRCFAKARLGRFGENSAISIIIVILLFIAWMDYANFKYIFVEKQIPDLVLPWLLQHSRYLNSLF